MSQHDFTIDNATFPTVRSDMNNAYKALASTNSGSSAPTTTYANQMWIDTAVSGTPKLKVRNSANTAWITLGDINESAGTFDISGEPQGSSGSFVTAYDTTGQVDVYPLEKTIFSFTINTNQRPIILDCYFIVINGSYSGTGSVQWTIYDGTTIIYQGGALQRSFYYSNPPSGTRTITVKAVGDASGMAVSSYSKILAFG